MFSSVYFSSLNRTFIGTTMDLCTAELLSGVATNCLRLLNVGNSSTKICAVYCTALSKSILQMLQEYSRECNLTGSPQV